MTMDGNPDVNRCALEFFHVWRKSGGCGENKGGVAKIRGVWRR